MKQLQTLIPEEMRRPFGYERERVILLDCVKRLSNISIGAVKKIFF